MADKNIVKRQVFISHLVDDPDWPPGAVAAVASAIRDSGIAAVRLDLWKQPAEARLQSMVAWRAWVDDAVIGASHILSLVSPRYHKQWQRRFEDSEDGLALAPISVMVDANQHGQLDYQRIVTLRPKGYGFECVPAELLGSLSYEWTADRHKLLSWLLGMHISLHEGDADRADGTVASSTQLSDDLILDGLHYPDRTEVDDSTVSAQVSEALATADGATLAVDYVADIGELSVVVEAHGISTPGVTPPAIEVEQEKTIAAQPKRVIPSSLGTSGMWTSAEEWRAPIGDFPPPWASAWGDDPYGLWADLTVNGATQRMRWIEPSGEAGFLMGSTRPERDAINDKNVRDWANQHEHEPRKERIGAGFWLADTPCTQAFWTAVAGKNPSHFGKGREAPERPVESVSWQDVMQRFVGRFAQTSEWGTGDRLCLPSEAQWEYAARAGTRTAYWWGDAWDEARGNVDVSGKRRWNDNEGTTPVQRYAPNPWGLYDVHGNVWEWCSDPWQPRRDAPEARPDEDVRVVRGGSWIYNSARARAAYRVRWPRRGVTKDQGFRFALRSPSGLEAR